jgi:hypothetical protein
MRVDLWKILLGISDYCCLMLVEFLSIGLGDTGPIKLVGLLKLVIKGLYLLIKDFSTAFAVLVIVNHTLIVWSYRIFRTWKARFLVWWLNVIDGLWDIRCVGLRWDLPLLRLVNTFASREAILCLRKMTLPQNATLVHLNKGLLLRNCCLLKLLLHTWIYRSCSSSSYKLIPNQR